MAKKLTKKQIAELLGRTVEEAILRDHLVNSLMRGETLRVKFGMDPTSPDLHIGHAVVFRLLRAFQDYGHKIIFIIGDYTARIGDPSGKSKTRPALDPKEIDRNAKTYFEQVSKVVDVKKAEIRYNSEWLSKLLFEDVIRLASHFTAARILERDDFRKRLNEGTDVHLHELFYPMMQAYDSVMIKADVEVGGTDQTYNLLAGRELQKKMGMDPQDVITVPLLVGTDGEHKMSKSLKNSIGITESSVEMYGKVMSIPDHLILKYYALATEVPEKDIAKIGSQLESKKINPRDLKMNLAHTIVGMYHSKIKADQAQDEFVKVFQKRELPQEIPVVCMEVGSSLVDALVESGLAKSKSEARRLISQKGVKIDGVVVDDLDTVLQVSNKGLLIQKGKRHFVRIKK